MQAWDPLSHHGRLAWATDTGRVLCGVHLMMAIAMGLSWWLTSGNDSATKAALGVFAFFLLPIAACIAIQLVSRIQIGVRPE
jgi:hypothetical protein